VPDGLVSKLHRARAAVLLTVAFTASGSRCSGPGRLWGLAASVAVGSEVLLLLKPPVVSCCWMDETVRPVNEHVCQHHHLKILLILTTLIINYLLHMFPSKIQS
jgi:hypothetical protein